MLRSKNIRRQWAQLAHSLVIISKVKCPWKTRILSTPPPGGFPSMVHAVLLPASALGVLSRGSYLIPPCGMTPPSHQTWPGEEDTESWLQR